MNFQPCCILPCFRPSEKEPTSHFRTYQIVTLSLGIISAVVGILILAGVIPPLGSLGTTGPGITCLVLGVTFFSMGLYSCYNNPRQSRSFVSKTSSLHHHVSTSKAASSDLPSSHYHADAHLPPTPLLILIQLRELPLIQKNNQRLHNTLLLLLHFHNQRGYHLYRNNQL